MVHFRIRPMILSDAEQVSNLSAELGYGVGSEEVEQRFACLAEDREHAVLVAEGVDGAILGWVHVLASKLLISPLSAEIGGLIVASGSRRRGVGAALMAAADGWARGKGCELVRLRSNVLRAEARGFYEALGYTNTKTSYTFEKRIEG